MSDRSKMHDKDQGGREGASGDLLQDKLREMKAARLNSHRMSKEINAFQDNVRGTQSSPAGSRRSRRDQDSDAPSQGDRRGDKANGKKGMGVKAIEDVRQLFLLIQRI